MSSEHKDAVKRAPMRHIRYFIMVSLIMIVIHYLVPYTILLNATNFALFAYWALLVLFWIIVTSIIVERWWFK